MTSYRIVPIRARGVGLVTNHLGHHLATGASLKHAERLIQMLKKLSHAMRTAVPVVKPPTPAGLRRS